MTLTIGGLFSGYGGLEMGVQATLGGEIAWHSEIEPGPCKVLEHHWPDVPNLGDVTAIDWANVEPVDIITGGSPCQDVSAAGRRAGMRPGTRSGLWESMREGIAVLRPGLVVWENVRGVTSAGAHSDLEAGPGLLGAADGRPHLRALGRVLGDLADLGYDAQWHGLHAADVGAPHGRFRIFVVASDTEPQHGRPWRGTPGQSSRAHGEPTGRGRASIADADGAGLQGVRPSGHRAKVAEPLSGRGIAADTSGDGRDEGWPESARLIGRSDAALSGDAATDAGCSGWREADTGGRDLVGQRRLQAGRHEGPGAHRPDSGSARTQWGNYAPAIARWERVLGRVAPAPTEAGAKGNQRLSPRFVEWMMGLPVGHVTDPVIGLTRNEQLKALGNGVVPQQAEAAIRVCLARVVERAA